MVNNLPTLHEHQHSEPVSRRRELKAALPVQELAVGYMSGKLLLKLDAISYILQHHASENFAFLEDPANSRNRSTFYYILARLLFMEDTPSKFKAFVAPLQQVFPPAEFRLSFPRKAARQPWILRGAPG